MSKSRHVRFDFSNNVWVPDKDNAFILGKINDIGSDDIQVELYPSQNDRKFDKVIKSFEYDSVHPAENESSKDVDDNCALMFLNPATVLYNIKRRYKKDLIYTYVANILLAINPYKSILNIYDLRTMNSYNGKSIGVMPPHIFAIGDKAFREMKHMRLNQSIIVSGESGSGKTESVKYILRYLTTSYGHQSGIIEERIVDSNPLLEAFGNAKTTRNNNSSRFGKFVELHFSKDQAIAGGYISHYLLERSRICSQGRGERNYHIFYQLCCAADQQLRDRLKLNSPDKFEILRQGCTQYFLNKENDKKVDNIAKSADHINKGALYDIQLDDLMAFQDCVRAMTNMGFDDDTRFNLFSTVAAIMHLGNVEFEPDTSNKEGRCVSKDKSKNSLNIASSLLQLSQEELHQALANRTMRPQNIGGKRGSMILVPLKVEDAMHARDALCKTIYVRLFDYLVKAVNVSIPPTDKSASYIGMLDIAGFEYLPINSFEQFCINYCNERLQQFFNARILHDEQDLYEHEGLGVRHIEYIDNQDCIDLIQEKSTGILDILDEESKLPQPFFTHFTSEVFNKNKSHSRLDLPRRSHLKLYREIRDDEGFLIKHFAGAVVYSTAQFIDKNNDAIHASLLLVVKDGTKSKFLKNLFEQHDEPAMAEGKLNFISVGNRFKTQLTGLLDRLKYTGTSFIRCIKPNENMRPLEFDGPHILTQLQCAGMLSVLELMQQGFPSRAKFNTLYSLYQKYLPPDLAKLDPRFFCKGLFHSLSMSTNDYKFGLTMVFFRPGKFAEFDVIMREDPNKLKELIGKVRCWLRKARWRKAQYYILCTIRIMNRMRIRREKIVCIQSAIRMFLETRKHKFRIQGLTRLTTLMLVFDKMNFTELLVTQQLKDDGNAIVGSSEKLRQIMKGYGDQKEINEKWVQSSLSSLSTKINNLVSTANNESVQQKKKQEEARLKTIQLELEEETKKNLAIEKVKMDLELEHKKRSQIEERRKREEHRIKSMQSELAKAATEDEKLQNAQKQLRKKEEQMKIDYHLAERLALSSGSEVDPLALLGLPKVRVTTTSKYNLTAWKYAQLRDTINTSCDIELLSACREEFHRRLKAYHIWKSRNKAKGAPVDRRIPQEIAEAINNMRAIVGSEVVVDNEQRFFRILLRDSNNSYANSATSDAAWYAHFDGRWICRQIEISYDKEIRPKMAGVDDIDMCELRLDETDLTSRKGVEILESDFEKIWNANGGLQYMAENYSRISSKYLQDKAKPLVDLFEFAMPNEDQQVYEALVKNLEL